MLPLPLSMINFVCGWRMSRKMSRELIGWHGLNQANVAGAMVKFSNRNQIIE